VNLGLGALASRRDEERRSYATITGVRNISLALLVSASYFPDPTTDAAILTFGLFTMALPFIVAQFLARSASTVAPIVKNT
jgi:BASS family bile acid:Na+ symporter